MKVGLPMNEVLLSVPSIEESTSGMATRPPEPFSEFACAFVETFDVTKKLPPMTTELAATYAFTVGLMWTWAVGTFTAIAAPPPPPADAVVSPLPGGGEEPRIEE